MMLEKSYTIFHFNEKYFLVNIFALLISIYAFYRIHNNVLQWHSSRRNRPPGPIGLPILGYLQFLGKEPHMVFWNMRKIYGDIISVYLGTKYTVVLNEYKVAKKVLSHPGSLNRVPGFLQPVDNVGFASVNGAIWVEQRRFVMSTAKDLGLGRDYWGIIIMEELSNFIQKLHEQKGKPFDISQDLVFSINASILSLIIGRRLGEDEIDKLHLSAEFSEILGHFGPSNLTLIVPGLVKAFEIFKIAGYDKVRETMLKFSSFLRDEIKRHKTSPIFHDIPDFINSYLQKISEMLKSNNNDHAFSEYMLEGNLNLLFVGASDTVYSSLTWLFRIMCKHKDIQEKVHTELMEVLGKERQARYEERNKIPYTFAVLMESQRHASNVPLSGRRRASQDIPVNGYIIPKGSDIITNLWALHHDPAYWDDPEEFRPERFLTEGDTKLIKHPPSYAPFSLGRRNCPGQTIGWMALLYYFSEILKRFKISTPEGVTPQFEVITGLVRRVVPQPLCFISRNI